MSKDLDIPFWPSENICKYSLQVPETCKENQDSFTSLEEAARLYADNQIPTDYPDYFCRQDIKDAFEAGAEWAMHYQEKKIADAYEKGKQEGIRVVRSWESSPGQGGY